MSPRKLPNAELVKLSNNITQIALAARNKQIALPGDLLVFIRPQKIARAVVGHILAANAMEEAKNGLVSAPFPDALRRYFLDENEPLPRHVDIYFWVYPSRRQVVIKNACKISMNRSGRNTWTRSQSSYHWASG